MKRIFKLSAVALTLALAGCGGSGGSEEPEVMPTSKQVKVIDGYLSNAQVFADRNADGQLAESELIGTTDENGEVELALDDEQHILYAQVLSGVTRDADRFGEIMKGYTLTAPGASDVITPYTTLFTPESVYPEDIASHLGLDLDLVTGDYVAAKGSKHYDSAVWVHAIARSLVGVMEEVPANGTGLEYANEVLAEIRDLQSTMDEHVNERGIDWLDTVTFVPYSSDTAFRINHGSLGDFLTAEEQWSIVSLNPEKQADEGVQFVQFNGEERTFDILDSAGLPQLSAEYLIDERRLLATGGFADEFVVAGRDLGVVKSSNGEMVLWSSKDLSFPYDPNLIASNQFTNQTWFMVNQISTDGSSDLEVITLEFESQDNYPSGVATLTKQGESSEGDYFISVEDVPGGKAGSVLNIHLSSADEPFRFIEVAKSGALRVMFDQQSETYSLFTKDESVLDAIRASF